MSYKTKINPITCPRCKKICHFRLTALDFERGLDEMTKTCRRGKCGQRFHLMPSAFNADGEVHRWSAIPEEDL